MTAVSIQSLLDSIVPSLGWTLVNSLWEGAVFAALLAVVLRMMRAAPANARYLVSCAALLLMVIATTATCAAVYIRLHPAPAALRSMMAMPTAPVDAAPAAIPLPPVAPAAEPFAPRMLRALVGGWALGVALMAAWHAAGWFWLRRLSHGQTVHQYEPLLTRLARDLKLRRRIRLISCPRIDVPAVVGVLRPVILVPLGVLNELTPQQVEAILAHELAHVRRHDYLINLIQATVETLMFYHPAIWWMSSRIREERENCCDDIAAATCGDARRYAAALAVLEERRSLGFASMAGTLATAADGGDLLNRVRRLLKLPPVSRTRRPNRVRSIAAAMLAIVCVGVPLACLAQQDQRTATTTISTTMTGSVTLETSPIQPEDLKAVVEDYRIVPGDVVNVVVADLVAPGVETVKTARVSDTGLVSLPKLDAVKLVGLTEVEASKAVAKAYKDANMLANANVGVSVNERRGRTFSIMGQVERPGQYNIPQSDFRVLDALVMVGTRPTDIDGLRVVRAGKEDQKKRVLEIPLDKLIAGEAGVNVVIRPGDLLVASPKEYRYVDVVVGTQSILLDGKPTDLSGVQRRVNDIPAAERRRTVLTIAAASPDVTVNRYFDTLAALSNMVKQYGLAYVSETGIHPTTEPSASGGNDSKASADQDRLQLTVWARSTSEAASEVQRLEARVNDLATKVGPQNPEYVQAVKQLDAAKLRAVDYAARTQELQSRVQQKEAQTVGEYYVMGEIPRVGVYSLTNRKITVTQAIAAAGGPDKALGEQRTFISILRREGDDEKYVMENVRLSDLLNQSQKDIYLKPNDMLRVAATPMETHPATAPATAP